MTPELARFFDAMAPLLRGDIDAETACAQIGGTPSSMDRLSMVASMVRRAREHLLANVYPATRAALGPEAWEPLVRRHLAAEASGEPDYPRIALGLPETLAADLPADRAFAHEVADWEEVLHRLNVAGAPSPQGAVRTPVIVRRYTFDVPAWVQKVRGGASAEPPGEGPILCMAWRDPSTGRARRHRPGAAELAALAVATGDATEEAVVSAGVDAAALRTARIELTRRGILGGD